MSRDVWPGRTHLLTGLYDRAPSGARDHRHAIPRSNRDLYAVGRGPDQVFNEVTIFNAHVADASHM